MNCKALLTHAEPDVGGTSLYVLVICKGKGRGSVEAPTMVKDAIEKAKRYEIFLTRSIEGEVKDITYEDGTLKFSCPTKCAFTIKVWAQTGTPVFPFLTDVELVRNSENSISFKSNVVSVRERGGVLVLRSVGTSKVIDLRNVEPLIRLPTVLAEPPVAPPKSVFAYFQGGELYFIGLGKKELVMKKEDIMDLSSYFYGLMIAISNNKKVDVVARKKGGWDVVDVVEERPLKVEWCLATNGPALALHYRNKLSLRSLTGETINITIPNTVASSISPDARVLLRATPDRVQVVSLEDGEVVKEFPLPGIKLIEWSFYSDFAVLCSDYACWVYSDLSKQIVVVKLINGVTGAWWSPSTYNLYLAKRRSLQVVSFNPRGVRGTFPAARRPIPRETS